MKRVLLSLIVVMSFLVSFGQDTIIGYSFPTATSLNPNMGLAINSGFQISYYSSDTLANDTITFTNGINAGEYAATATHWDNGMNTKYWMLKFKAPQYSNIFISSKQRGGGISNPGPKDFKLQWKLNNGTFVDLTNGAITVGNDWTTGIANNLLVPTSTLQTNDTIYIRWIMTSNINISGSIVASNGVGKIDDILVVGTNTVGVHNNSINKEINIFPNPSNGIINIETQQNLKELTIYNIIGKRVYQNNNNQSNYIIDMSSFGKGLYFIKTITKEGKTSTSKISIK